MINIADELNAATEQAIIGRAAQIKDTSLNKTQSTINAEVQKQLANIGKSTPFVSADGNVLKIYMYTLKQLELMRISTSTGEVKFSITFNGNTYILAYSDDSPAAIAGETIQDDSKDMYDEEYVFGELELTFPDGWSVSGVYVDTIDANLLDEGDTWRFADIRRLMSYIRKAVNTMTSYVLGILSNGAKETTAQQAATDAAAAKTAAQAITGYALQGSDTTATNTAIASLIGYTIQEIDGV